MEQCSAFTVQQKQQQLDCHYSEKFNFELNRFFASGGFAKLSYYYLMGGFDFKMIIAVLRRLIETHTS